MSAEQLRDAARVEVIATEYQWSGLPDTVAPGPTVFEFRNDGEELHELFMVQLVDGVDPDVAIETAIAQLESGEPQTEDPPENARRLGGARGGPPRCRYPRRQPHPGTYLAFCFLPDPQGVSHARLGMTASFQVTP